MVNKTKRTIQDTDSCVRRPVPFFYVRFYITLFFDRLCRNVYDRLLRLLYDLLEGLAVLADNVDALLQSVCAVSHLSATDG